MLGICKTLEQEMESVIRVQQRELPYSQKAKKSGEKRISGWMSKSTPKGGGWGTRGWDTHWKLLIKQVESRMHPAWEQGEEKLKEMMSLKNLATRRS